MIAGIVTLLAIATLLASLSWLHLQPTHLSPLRNAVSQYGITSYRAGYRVATLAFAAAGIALTVGITARLHARGQRVELLLIVFAAARGTISWFPMDAPGAQPTRTGQMHRLLALGAFAVVTDAAFKLPAALVQSTGWHSLRPVSTALGWVMLACLLAMALRRSLPCVGAWFGAIERAFYLAAIAWFTVFAIACLHSR